MPPVHDREIGRPEPLARHLFRLRQPGDNGADFVRLPQQCLPIFRRDQIVEDRAGDDEEIALGERLCDERIIERHVTIGPEFKAAIAGCRRLVEDAFPGGKVWIVDVINAPAAGGCRNRDGHGFIPDSGCRGGCWRSAKFPGPVFVDIFLNFGAHEVPRSSDKPKALRMAASRKRGEGTIGKRGNPWVC